MPAAAVWMVTVAYPLVKSMVASATCLPSGVFNAVVSACALDDPDEDGTEDPPPEDLVAQPLIRRRMTPTAMTNPATRFMDAAYPRLPRRKRDRAAPLPL